MPRKTSRVPLSFFGGIGGASRKGILIKGSSYLELLSKVDTIVFDKTGTLTKGSFSVSKIVSETLPEEELLQLAAAAESILGDTELTSEQSSLADIDGNDTVNISDLARLKQYISNKITSIG